MLVVVVREVEVVGVIAEVEGEEGEPMVEGRVIVDVEPALSQGFGGEGRPLSPPPTPGMRRGSTPDEPGGSIQENVMM